MVRYQGPQIVEGLVRKLQIPFFDHVTAVSFTHVEANPIPLVRSEVNNLPFLRSVVLQPNDPTETISKDHAASVSTQIPPCRLKSSSVGENALKLEVAKAGMFACSGN